MDKETKEELQGEIPRMVGRLKDDLYNRMLNNNLVYRILTEEIMKNNKTDDKTLANQTSAKLQTDKMKQMYKHLCAMEKDAEEGHFENLGF